ncbi:MAG: alternative ribosome rescue aminoacyl-tRNA hydrolase ArfB [Acidimicrobiia bacterium]
MDDLQVTADLVVPSSELSWSFSTSGGPGGQHANRSASRATLRLDVAESSAFDSDDRIRLLESLGSRLVGGVLSVSVDESRSQWRNRQMARSRLADLLREALAPPPPLRRPSRPGRAARRRRLETKRRRGATKRLRKPPEPE